MTLQSMEFGREVAIVWHDDRRYIISLKYTGLFPDVYGFLAKQITREASRVWDPRNHRDDGQQVATVDLHFWNKVREIASGQPYPCQDQADSENPKSR